jgi:hypothetical protein
LAIYSTQRRIFVDGVDISKYVRGFSIEASVGAAMTVSLDIIAPVTMSNGNLHIGDPPPAVSMPSEAVLRAMNLEGVKE